MAAWKGNKIKSEDKHFCCECAKNQWSSALSLSSFLSVCVCTDCVSLWYLPPAERGRSWQTSHQLPAVVPQQVKWELVKLVTHTNLCSSQQFSGESVGRISLLITVCIKFIWSRIELLCINETILKGQLFNNYFIYYKKTCHLQLMSKLRPWQQGFVAEFCIILHQ